MLPQMRRIYLTHFASYNTAESATRLEELQVERALVAKQQQEKRKTFSMLRKKEQAVLLADRKSRMALAARHAHKTEYSMRGSGGGGSGGGGGGGLIRGGWRVGGACMLDEGFEYGEDGCGARGWGQLGESSQ